MTEQALRALARGLAESEADRKQALEALRRGLAEHAKDLRESGGDPLATGSLSDPVPHLWTAPVLLRQSAAIDPSPAPARESDVERLFDPDPLGRPSRLRRTTLEKQLARLPEPRLPPPAPPPPLTVPPADPPDRSAAPQPSMPAPPTSGTGEPAREQARLPDAQPAPPARARPESPSPEPATPPREQARAPEPEPAPRPEPPATAGLEFPVTPPARPREMQPMDETEEQKASPSEKPTRAKPARKPAPRTRAAKRVEPPTQPESDDGKVEAPARPRAAPKATVRRKEPEPEATGSVTRGGAARAIVRPAPGRAARSVEVRRPVQDARRQPSDISIIPLPDALRPTRPPAGSPL